MIQFIHRHKSDIERLVAAWGAFIVAINWNAVAAFLTCVFTLLLILEKIGLLNPLKNAVSRRWQALKGKGADKATP